MGRAICDSRARIKNNVMPVAAADAIPAGLLERIAAGESQTLEFKTSFDKASIESLVAFANAQGGTVLVPALREALLNAVVHRSYTDPSDIQIKIFDDQITLFSPGTFYGGISIADIQADNYRSSLRNKLVAEGFYLINAIEKYGSGFIRIRQALQDYPGIDFEIKEYAGGVMVTFAQKQPVGGVSGGVSGETLGLLQLIRSHPGLKAAELATRMNKPKRTIERWLKQLKNSQHIEFRGAPKTGGYYPKQS